MEHTARVHTTQTRSWMITIASMLPLWLLSLAIMSEGFPRPPVPAVIGIAFTALAASISIFNLWKGWMRFDLLLYSLIPLVFLFYFDEITTRYKSPFIFLSALILTIGLLGYHRSHSWLQRMLVLLFAAVITLFLAANAADNFWEMTADQGIFAECFPDFPGCPPLPDFATSWWRLFFKP